jgi:hypothetical protein
MWTAPCRGGQMVEKSKYNCANSVGPVAETVERNSQKRKVLLAKIRQNRQSDNWQHTARQCFLHTKLSGILKMRCI